MGQWQHYFYNFDDVKKFFLTYTNFIGPEVWPPNSSDLNPVDYKIWGLMQDRNTWCRQTEAASDRCLGRHEAEHDQQGYCTQCSVLQLWCPISKQCHHLCSPIGYYAVQFKKKYFAAFYRGWFVVVHPCSNFYLRRQSVRFQTADFPIFCARIIVIFWTMCTGALVVFSTQFIDIWQLWSWIKQTRRTHNKTQSIETQEHKNTQKTKKHTKNAD